MEKYKGKYAATAAQKPFITEFTLGKTFSGLHLHEQIKTAPIIKINAYQIYIWAELKPIPNPLIYWNLQYSAQPKLTWFAFNILAILFINAECKKVFSSAKHLVTNTCNYFKADIIETNECLKFWYRCLRPKAFKQNINLDINDLYEKELTAKAAVKTAAKKDSNA